MSIDTSIISLVLTKPSKLKEVQRAGITSEHFVDEYANVWRWIQRNKLQYGTVPSRDVAESRFHDLDIHRVKDRDIPVLINEIQHRKKWMDFVDIIDVASREAATPDDVERAIGNVIRKSTALSVSTGRSPVVDLFSEEIQKKILVELRKRRRGEANGIPTGFNRIDTLTGGLQKQTLTAVFGRPGLGKSWLNALFVASAVKSGAKVMLFPLEMNLFDVACRLYTVFSCQMFGPSKALKNLDLTRGHISVKRVQKFLAILEDKYEGQLFVADIGSMQDPYTVERVNAEVQMHRPQLFLIDYLSLMKAPGVGRDGNEDYTTIKALSNGCKMITVANDCAGVIAAQVNRDAIKGGHFLPRLENLSFGDSIAADIDKGIAINRKGPHLYYAMIKNRGGVEIGRTRCSFAVNSGDISETKSQEDDDD